MGVSLLGGEGVREHVVDDRMEPESALPERGREGRDDVWLQITGPGFVNLAPGGSLRSKKGELLGGGAKLVIRPVPSHGRSVGQLSTP